MDVPIRWLDADDGLLGTLYLGVFSGPVEGIIIICIIYIVTGICGGRYKNVKSETIQLIYRYSKARHFGQNLYYLSLSYLQLQR